MPSKVRWYRGWGSQVERMEMPEEKLEIIQEQEDLTAFAAISEVLVVHFFLWYSLLQTVFSEAES